MKIGIILNNIGTPKSYSPADVGEYLREFLMDKNIIGAPWLIRYILVNWIIVPRRQFQSAEKYKRIWGQNKSPLLEITEQFSESLQKELGDQYVVEIGMRYGDHNIAQAIQNLKKQNVEHIIFVPLYPQFAQATTGSAVELFKSLMSQETLKYSITPDFYNKDFFTQQTAYKMQKEIDQGQYEHIVFSFHGLPESQVRKNIKCELNQKCCERLEQQKAGCYRAQCFATAHLIAQKLKLPKQHYSVTFQSRLGPTQWIKPYTQDTIVGFAKDNIKNVLVVTPSFVADCIETLEEIALEVKHEFITAGGSDLKLVSCLNADDGWVRDFSSWISKEISSKII